MRIKMRDHLGGKKAGRFMLKQDEGGITDIEFLAQYDVVETVNEETDPPPSSCVWGCHL
ncbi:glutamate-ammonia-ligase adenylyltransferase [Vibrio cholerae]|nr:glutamate-ammonia-ligase adenylyltransferase [Vibrio cholerae]